MATFGKAFRIGPLVVKRIPASNVSYRTRYQQHWRGYLCCSGIPRKDIGMFGKLVDVTSREQLEHEQDVYRAEMDIGAEVLLAYYEVIDADA